MSYDLHVFTARALEATDILAICDGLVRCRSVGDTAASFAIERSVRGNFRYAVSVDGALRVDRDDLPESVLSAAAGIRWTYQLAAADAGPTLDLARRIGRELARRGDGVVFDPQRDAVVWPRASRRRFKPEPSSKVDVVRFSWYVRREDMEPDIPEAFFDVVRRHVPEAVPRKFGTFEPLQGRLEEVGKDGFAAEWRAASVNLSWTATPPSFGGGMFGLGADLIGAKHAGAHPIGSVGLMFDGRAFLSAPWRDDAIELFAHLARRLGSFFAYAHVEHGVGYSRGALWYDVATLGPPSGPVVRNVWYGLPAAPVWLAWFGDLYREVIEGSALPAVPEPVRDGLLVRSDELPPEIRPADDTRAEPRESVGMRLPRDLLVRISGDGPGTWESSPADVVPDGLSRD